MTPPFASFAHCRLNLRLASASALVQPARLPRASSRLARASADSNVACALPSARLTEPGVGWCPSCAPIVWEAVGPAPGVLADWRTTFSNCAILAVQGPACADATLRINAAPSTGAVVNRRFMMALQRFAAPNPFRPLGGGLNELRVRRPGHSSDFYLPAARDRMAAINWAVV